MANGFGLSGQPFVGADVGGFQGHSNAELFLRWMQYGALTPFCRNHSMLGNVDQYAWAWGDAVLDRRARARSSSATGCCPTSTRVHPRVRDRRAGPAAAGLRPPGRRRRARHRRPVPVRPRPARRARVRAAHDRAPGLPARGRVVRLAHGRALTGRRFVVAADADGPDPALRARRRRDPDVAEAPPSTAGYHPDEIELHVFPPDAEARLVPARGRRADVRRADSADTPRAHRQHGAYDERGRLRRRPLRPSSTASEPGRAARA